MSRPMNRRQLLEELKRLLNSPSVAVRKGRLRREHGLSVYDRDKNTNELIDIKITIDPRNAAKVTVMIHELLHIYLAQKHNIDFLFSTPIEEAIVTGLAEDLGEYLHNPENESLFHSWVRAVEAKLA